MQVGCYTLDLYCDNSESAWTCATDIMMSGETERWPIQYTHELGTKCRKDARRDGWTLTREKTICPHCNGKVKS